MSASPPFPSPETLLAQSRFLRPIVRALLGGQDGEDDVIQEAAIRAWQAESASGRSPSWLARIARNLSFDRLRAARRRERLRQHAVWAECPSPDEVLQQEEVRQRLVRAVLALPQPYRGVVLLRFWEDLPPSQIAARLALPGATVRSQLARGLQLLRERLDAEPGGRSAWRAAVLPCAGWGKVGPGVAARVLLMTKLKLAAVAMVVVSCGLGLWWWGADPALGPIRGADASGRGGAPAAVSGGVGDQPSGASPTGSASPAADRTAVHRELLVRGRVRHDGRPFAGLHAALQWFDGFTIDGAPTATTVVVSDASGGFEWRGPERESPAMLNAVVAPGGPPLRLWCTPELVVPSQSEVELNVDVVPLDRVVFGRVHTRDGAPIAGARLDINLWPDSEVRSDAEGRYELHVPEAGYPMTVRAPGFQERLIDAFRPAGALRHQFDVEMLPAATLVGRVVDAGGTPVAGAKVKVSGGMHGVDTASDGTFTIDGLRPGEQHEVSARKAGWRPGSATAAPGDPAVEIVLNPGLRIELRVRNTAGAPVPGAAVYLIANPMAGWDRLGFTSTAGTFAALDLPERPVELIVQRRGYQTVQQTVDVRETTGELVVTLAPGWSIRGTVVDTAGKPVAGASVYCNLQDASAQGRSVGTRDDTDAEGRFEIHDIPAAPCTVFAYHPDHQRAEFAFVGGTVVETTLTLTRALAFAGRVVDGATGAAIGNFTVDIEPDPELPVFASPRPFATTDGVFRLALPQLKAGLEQTLVITSPGFGAARLRAMPEWEPVADHHVVTLYPGVDVTGVVRDPVTGRPLAGVTVALATNDPRVRPNEGPATDATGRFAIPSVAAGDQRLRLQHRDRPEVVFGPFTVGRGPGTLEVQPTMGVGVTMRGRVVGPGAVAGLVVSAFRDDGRNVEATVRDDGRFELRGLGPGSTVLHIAEGTGRTRMQRIDVGSVDLDDVELHLRSGAGAVLVTALGIERGEVSVKRLDARPGERSTHDQVAFAGQPVRIDGLAPGRYRVMATSAAGDRRGIVEVDVGAGDVDVTVECKLRR